MGTFNDRADRVQRYEEKKAIFEELKKVHGEENVKIELNRYAISQSKYKPEFCQLVVDHMSQGFDFDTLSHRLGVTPQTMYNWVKKYPDFNTAYHNGKSAQKEFYQKLCLNNAITNKGNASMCIFLAKNKLNYTDKQQIDTRSTELIITTQIGADGVITKQMNENETKQLLNDALDANFDIDETYDEKEFE